MEEPTISFNELIHPDMDAIAKRDAFLSDENGKKLKIRPLKYTDDMYDNDAGWPAEEIEKAIAEMAEQEDKFKGKCVPTKGIRTVIEANMDMQDTYLPVHFLDLVESMPQMDIPKHGSWTVLEDCSNRGIYCSECQCKIFDFTHKPKEKISRYCPHCGSKNEKFFRDGEVVFR